MKRFLHVGCGQKTKESTTRAFNTQSWEEVRFDIDHRVKPDVVGTMTDMGAIDSLTVDAIYSSHNIEHLYPHEVGVALAEFYRVLKKDGFVMITCPDLQSVCQLIADDKLLEPAYTSPAGPIAPIDMVYGYRPSMAAGNLYMSHRSGFTQKTLSGTFRNAGFKSVAVARREAQFDLFCLASKKELAENELITLAKQHFPQ
ncbi:class I SAM-dependent methyltransferase [Gammaproteobacteria bacterium]|nr:class I SAM-dependent methyltransferase [Gammaproteobacteria bacterium]